MNWGKGLGAIKSPKDVRDYRAACTVSTQYFPDDFELWMPEVKDQGTIGSCVAHSLATVVEYFSHEQGDDTRTMSTGYIYGNRTSSVHTGEGMIVRDALATTCTYGTVPNEFFPYNIEVPVAIQVFENKAIELYPHGYPNRFTSYYRLNSDNDIKASLMQHGPVVFAMEWYADIDVNNGQITTDLLPSDTYHCMVIYGWNQHGWKVQNSWGTGFADNGRVILPYDVPKTEVWGIVDTYSEAQRVLYLKELEWKNSQLISENIALDQEVQALTHQIVNYQQQQDEHQRDMEELIQQFTEKTRALAEKQEELDECQADMHVLRQELLVIQKPFQSGAGQVIAKILNFIYRVFRHS